jgi:hypothetical protein
MLFCAQMLAMVSLPFFLQSMMGRSEVETGLLLTPWPLATMVMAPLAGYLIEKVHAGLLGAMGLLVMACGLFGLALLPSAPSDLDIIWRMALCGAGFGLFQSPNNHTIVSSAPAIAAAAPAACWGPRACLDRAPAPRWWRCCLTCWAIAEPTPPAAGRNVCRRRRRRQRASRHAAARQAVTQSRHKKIRSPKVADFCFQGQRRLFQVFAAAQGFNTFIQRRVSHKQLAHGFRFTVNAERHHAAGFLRLIAGFQTLQRGNHFLTPYQLR